MPREDYERIKSTLLSLASEARPPGVRKLSAREGWRVRVGHYRVSYEIDDQRRVTTVLHVGHRKDVYRKL